MKRIPVVVAGLLFAAAAVSAADDKSKAAPPMSAEQQAQAEAWARMSEVRAEHKQLNYFVGSWKTKTRVWMDPKAPPMETVGASKVAAIYGGRYVTFSYQGDFMGQPFEGQGYLGYDNLRGKFFSTWIDSMATGFWLSWGDYDKASNAWTFRGETPDPLQPKTMIKVRQVMRIHDENHYSFEWNETKGGGKEAHTMTIDYHRQ